MDPHGAFAGVGELMRQNHRIQIGDRGNRGLYAKRSADVRLGSHLLKAIVANIRHRAVNRQPQHEVANAHVGRGVRKSKACFIQLYRQNHQINPYYRFPDYRFPEG